MAVDGMLQKLLSKFTGGGCDIDIRKPDIPARENSADAMFIPPRRQYAAEGRNAYMGAELIGSGIDEISNTAIGTGRRLKPLPEYMALGWTPEQYTLFVQQTKSLFRRHMYSKRNWIDQTGDQNLADMQRMMLANTISEGESYTLAFAFENPIRPFRVSLGIIDPDQIRTPENISEEARQNFIAGHLKSAAGRTSAYAVHEYHRNDPRNIDGQENYTLVRRYNDFGREQVIHSYIKKLPGMTRGISHLASAFSKLRCFEKYEKIRIEAALLQLAFAFVIKSNDKNVLGQMMGQNNPIMADPKKSEEFFMKALDKAGYSQEYYNNNSLSLEGAKAIRLIDGEDAEILTANQAQTNDKQFVDECYTSIARSFGLTKSTLTQQFEGSYSSARAELISFYRQCEVIGELIVSDWLQRVYTIWLEDVIQLGLIDIPNYSDPNEAWLHFVTNRELYCNADFCGPARDEIDQAKSMQYWMDRKKIGAFTYEDFYNSRGKDWQEAIDSQLEELKYIDAAIDQCDFKHIKNPLAYILTDIAGDVDESKDDPLPIDEEAEQINEELEE